MPIDFDDCADARMDDDGCCCHLLADDEVCAACDYGGAQCPD